MVSSLSFDSESVLDAIENRRSIREFVERLIAQEHLHAILKAGSQAPSAGNRQPWRFFVVENRRVRFEIAHAMDEALREDRLETNHRLTEAEKSSVHYSARAIEQAPILVLVYYVTHDAVSEAAYSSSDMQSIGACMQNMALAAHALGISSVWLCDVTYVEQQINELVEVGDLALAAALALGYKNPDIDYYVAPRRSLHSTVIGSV